MRGLSLFLFLLSAAMVITGFIFMFHYGDYDEELQRGSSFGHVVGGDAYNFMINGIRGLGFIITGAIFSVVATGLFLYSKNDSNIQSKQVQASE